jgi:RimJ/RimL family protein N-acetyltransferase
VQVKVLETKRLILRWFTPDDASFVYELLNEPAWKRYIGDRGIDSVEAARDYIETVPIASYRRHGFGLFAVELKANGTLVGMCGLIKRNVLKDVDIGFALVSRFEGHGLAHEAAAATLVYSRNTLGLDRVVAITSLDNERSARLLERLGMRYERLVCLSDDAEQLRLYSITLRPGENMALVPDTTST